MRRRRPVRVKQPRRFGRLWCRLGFHDWRVGLDIAPDRVGRVVWAAVCKDCRKLEVAW